MANLTETPGWTGIYQLERTDAVDAGVGGAGISNLQATQLGNRTAFLRQQLYIPGEIKSFAFPAVPTGYLVCNGQAVSRTTYSDLFAAIGVTFGPGNGSTTFNVPDLRGQFLRGFSNGGAIDGSRPFGTTQAATTIGDHVTLFGSNEIRVPIGNPDSGSGSSVTHGTAAGSVNSSQQTYSIRPDNVAVLFAIKF